MTNKTRDYGDLRVTLTKDLVWKWNEKDTGAARYGEFYLANSQGAMRPVGSFGQDKWDDQKDKRATILVGNVPGSSGTPAVASPTSYDWVWDDRGGGGKYDGTVWRPIAPTGYVSLGDVWTSSYERPSTNAIWCVRSDLTMQSHYNPNSLWDDTKSGGNHDCSVWSIIPPQISIHGTEKVTVLSDCHRAIKAYRQPSSDLARVLVLPCPKNFKSFSARPPTFTKDTIPREGDLFSQLQQCEVELPFTAFFPPTHVTSLGMISDPFCKLGRRTAWLVEKRHSNNGGGTIIDEKTIKKGISTTQSQEMVHSAGVEITSSFGIKALGGGIDVSLNYQFTSTQSSSYNEYEEFTDRRQYNVPPYTCSIFLTERVWLVATRTDGSFTLSEIQYNTTDGMNIEEVKLN
ncbi:hypothetical protein J4E90_010384 [Alternaria incomplexa]|uniref:uncharacterized protein n=1 Tax=Alternaria incomplexa TaxID=1187928 RepID=UPI00222022E3|nr:uncharacterized protein J4E90_010384 [Alternaria incomplexa]KAI4906696.1 hypothetical protein J4E90_010384 [Alternaria incomplexa]